MTAFKPRVGLEVHVRLATQSKLFCSCPNVAGGTPNAATCPVCAGLPGAMPTLNRRAVELALRAALILNCDVAPQFAFDRKHYAYPDLPKGYQTTQSRQPLATGGSLTLTNGRSIALTQLHIEDDAGRSRHDARSTHVDLSRAGAPLAEIVTEPVLTTPEEVRDFLLRLREELRFGGVSDCDMEKGSLRFDVNVSLAAPGAPGFARVELKNLNSIRAAGEAVASEFARQAKLIGQGPGPTNETRGWHATSRSSFPMRAKEHATDYRFLPEPDLPAVRLTAADIEAVRADLPEGPRALRTRYKSAFALTEAEAQGITKTPARAAYFEAVVAAGAPSSSAAKWVLNALGAAARERASRDLKSVLPATQLAELLVLRASGALSRAGAETVFESLIKSPHGKRAQVLAEELGLRLDPAKDATEVDNLDSTVQAALAAHADAVRDFAAGKHKALDALVGAVMREAKGQLDGGRVRAAILDALAR